MENTKGEPAPLNNLCLTHSRNMFDCDEFTLDHRVERELGRYGLYVDRYVSLEPERNYCDNSCFEQEISDRK